MNRILPAIALTLAAALSPVLAQTPSLSPKDARSMGMGGVFNAISSGYASFYGNPAGFARSGSLTLVDASAWTYFDPSPANLSRLQRLLEAKAGDPEIRSILGDYLASNGLGAGEAVGLGWTGGGVGLGAFVTSENSASGSTIDLGIVTSRSSANLVLGLGIPLIKSDTLSLSVGGDVRPFFRVDSAGTGWNLAGVLDPILAGETIESALSDQTVTSGYGLAMDFGALLEVGPFLFGISVRDVSPSFQIANTTIGELLNFRIPAGPYSATSFQPQIAAGASVSLRLIPGILDSRIHAEMKDVGSLFSGSLGVLDSLHAGADFQLVKFLTLRAGLSGGHPSCGFGLDLALIEFDAAYFRESSATTPSGTRTGISLQAALRL